MKSMDVCNRKQNVLGSKCEKRTNTRMMRWREFGCGTEHAKRDSKQNRESEYSKCRANEIARRLRSVELYEKIYHYACEQTVEERIEEEK